MLAFQYDKSFEGLLCAVFDAFEQKKMPDCLLAHNDLVPLLVSDTHHVEVRNSKYERVQVALNKKLSHVALNQLKYVWLSELPESDFIIFRYICKVFKSKHPIETDFGDPDVLIFYDIAKKVSRERHHLMQFVRFNTIENPIDNTNDGQNEKIYFSVIAPIYNALPLVLDFFKDRYADQKWAIYDEKRKYGYFYDLDKLEKISLVDHDELIVDSQVNKQYLTKDEKLFQTLWHRYFNALSIKERENPKLQRQQMPKRFWHNLPEMKGK